MGNANETSPLGSVSYNIRGYQDVTDPSTGRTYSIPQYDRNQTLSPEQQQLYDQQTQLGSKLNNLGIQQADKITNLLGSPMDTSRLPAQAGDMSAYRQQVETGMNQRLNPQLDRDRNALETKLINQGLVRGSDAFNQAMDESNRQANDAHTQVMLASGQEARSQASQQDQERQQAFQEQVATRNQPINEITALMSGGQVSMPQFQGYNPGQVAGTPVGQYVYNSAQLNQQGWQAQQQMQATNNAAIYGAVGNMAGAGLYKWSDARLKRDVAFSHVAGGRRFYRYRYLWDEAWQVGVMAQENPDVAVLMPNGFFVVNYGAL